MSNLVQNVNKINTGTCPHGLSPGACPICSMGGGSSRHSDKTARALGEMTYHECAMLGAMLKARSLAEKNHKLALEQRSINLEQFSEQLNKFIQTMQTFENRINNSLLFKPIVVVVKNILIPTVKLLQNMCIKIEYLINKLSPIKEIFVNILDKLTAIYGEIKNFINKKVSEIISSIKSKIKNIFRIFKKDNTDDNDTKIDDDKKIFNLKNFINKILKRKQNDSSKGK